MRRAIGLTCWMLCLTGAIQAQGLNPTQTETNAFMAADRDGNGVLTYSEFKIFVRAMAAAGQPTAKQIRFFGAYRMAFGIADMDGNGAVTPWEMRNADNDFRAGQ